MKFRIVEDCRKDYPVRVICRALDVSASGYYAWRDRPESPRKAENHRLLGDIQRLHHEHAGRYGSPRIHIALGEEGWTVSRGRVARVMRRHGIQAKQRRAFRPCTTDSNHTLPVAPNLLNRQVAPDAPGRAWVADISYIPTDGGWLYLAVVLDLFSRKVVGWAMRDHMRTELPLAALMMATQRQKLSRGLIQHSDRGSQYASHEYRKALKNSALVASMSRKANCGDNAPMESFFGTLKTELVNGRRYAPREEAKRDLFAYIDGYDNRRRLHSALGYITPEQAELRAA